MPYYTGAGDSGSTMLCDSKKISKSSLRISAIGDVDELNSHIGLCRSVCKDKDIDCTLCEVQNELFILGSDLAVPIVSKRETKRITEKHVKRVECEIDGIAKEVGEQKGFILPGGSELAARIHVARAVCRRAERVMVALSNMEKINEQSLAYINRLSSLLFVTARMANERAGKKETECD